MTQNIKRQLRIFLFMLTVCSAVCLFSGTAKQVQAATQKYVTASTLAVRKKPSVLSKKVTDLPRGTKVLCYAKSGNWTKIIYKGKYRYVYTSYLSTKKPATVTEEKLVTKTGNAVVDYACKFLGNSYVYGGTSLTKGTDCSGFTQSIYRHFGYVIPRTSTAQRKAGKAVSWSKKEAGDLICYDGHVAIYMGNNKVIHASNAKEGIKITSPANYRKVVCVRRIIF